MSTAVPASEAGDEPSATSRRKSGRVSKKPERFAPASSPTGSSKRKRGDNDDSGVDANEDPSDDTDESSEDDLDDDERRSRQRKQKGKAPARKSAPKKPKTNGESVSLAIRPSANAAKKIAKRPRKAAIRKSTLPEETEGLYADVFASGDRLEDVTARWAARFTEHEAKAVAEIVNLVLTASGCDIRINEDDIADPDNAPSRVAEIVEEYAALDVTEYPLIAKAKDGGGLAFRKALQDFFNTLVQTAAQSGFLFEHTELMENISVWLGALSSTGNRPFRHTSTVCSLAITTALAQVAADLVENTAKRLRQSEAESKKSRVNKARVSAADKEVAEYNQKLQIVESSLDDWFSVVYVHRYRDVDHRIRMDCVVALADWILAYPDKFFDGTKLRYLGWVLSDPNPPTRVEVLHQLARLFRDENKLAGLKTFTERFRPRIVEIATKDAENNVRAAAVDLLDILREAGFLEPDDIDSVGNLIFDSDAKVRKSVVGFFAENVNAAYEAIVDDMGGEEALNEALAPPDDDDEEYHNPRLEWLKLKCLIDQLLSYAEDGAELPSHIERISSAGVELGLVAAGVESRYSIAAQSLFDAVPELQSWEVITGFLLYDHSQAIHSGAGDDAETMLRQNCQLDEKHETILLDVLNAVVRLQLQRLAEAQKGKGKTKAQREEDQEDQSNMAKRLALLIPQLLKKFGALPETSALCLRLERELNLDTFQEMRQNVALAALLDDINKQFLTHHNERVLTEAIGSIIHAQENDDLKETITLKIQSLWDDVINTFDALRRGRELATRGNLSQNILVGLSNVVLKISQLATSSDTAVLDYVSTPPKSKSRAKKAALDTPPIATILELLERAIPVEGLNEETDEAEDTLTRRTMSIVHVYFLWKYHHCVSYIGKGTPIPEDDLTALVERREAFEAALVQIMEHRKGADEIRREAATLYVDIFAMFRALQHKKVVDQTKTPKKARGRGKNDAGEEWEVLCQTIDANTTKLLLQILTANENHLAKLLNKRLEEPDVDDEPIDPDDEPESDGEGDDNEIDDKQVLAILADQSLSSFAGCLLRAVLGGCLDGDGSGLVRKRLERNKTKLTATYKEVINHLDAHKQRKGGKRAAARPAKAAPAQTKSTALVVDSDEEEGGDGEGDVEVQGDEIEDEDEDMAEADADAGDEAVNGVAENGDGDVDGDEESVLGD
ncbi:STAG-domain-containing protein [Pyrenochaeta sp. DS3sAY3a]|nr:STAG-domain-containing protein [Pyrenochaeta sp. DS3sAY3a]